MSKKSFDFVCGALLMTTFISIFTACGTPAAQTALDIVREPAIDLLTRVIADRFGSGVDKGSAYCEELPDGFRSGIEELDEDDRGAFVMCWARAAE